MSLAKNTLVIYIMKHRLHYGYLRIFCFSECSSYIFTFRLMDGKIKVITPYLIGEFMPNNFEINFVQIDNLRIETICDAYFKWKDLNTYVKQNSTRGINMPDVISEPMACYCLGFLWNRGSVVGDATDPNSERKIEFKATSKFDGDLSSFGPNTVFDDLYFLRFNLEDDQLYIYDLKINSVDFGKYPANATESIEDQKRQGRRPHVSLYKLFVEPQQLKPIIRFDIRRIRILEDNR